MRNRRLLASLVAVALAAVSMGTATAWFSDSATIRFEITAADNFGPGTGEKVWVCKLVGPPDDPSVKPGKNPIHVSVESIDAEEGFSDAHPSYVVEHGDVVCEVPKASPVTEVAEPVIAEAPAVEETPDPPDPTTTTTVEELTTTTVEPTTTTTESAPTTTAPEVISTTTSTLPDNDE